MGRKNKARRADPHRQIPDKQDIRWIMVFLAVVSCLLYINTLGHDFVFDDITLILQNPQVLDFDLSGIFSLQGYRPVRTLTHALEWALVGQAPMFFHLNNIILHVFNVLLVFLVLNRLAGSWAAALAGSVLFMVHPVQTAAVAYISGRKDLLATAFILLGFWFYVKAGESIRGGGWRYPAAWGCFGLALLSKEVAIVFPVLLMGLDMVRDDTGGRVIVPGRSFFSAAAAALRRRPFQYAIFSVLAVAALVWAVFINLASRAEGYWGGTLLTNLGTGFKLFAHYLKLVFVPYPLIADYTGEVFPVASSIIEPSVVFSFLLIIAYLAFAVWIFRKSPLFCFGMLWFAAALSPVLHFIPFHELAADHFLYFPLVGAALCAAAAFRFFEGGRPGSWKTGVAGILVVLAVGSGIMTVHRNRAWKDQETLWKTTYAQAPGSYRANVNLGQMAFSEQRTEEGIEFTERAIELDPEKAVPRSNLGALYYTLGQQASMARDYSRGKNFLHKSIEYCRTALELDPERIFTAVNYGSAYKELANIADAEGDAVLAERYRQEAERFYMRALNSGDERRELKSAWLNLGMMYIDAGKFGESLAYIDNFLDAYQGRTEAWRGYYWKGYSQYTLGRFEEAAASFEMAAELNPDMSVFNSLVNCYEKLGDEEKKIRTFERALELNPRSFNALYNLGLIYQEKGEPEKSILYFRRALEADPDNMLADAIRQHLEESGAGR